MPTISWLIERLLVKPTEGPNTDVVITADWRCNGSQDSYSGTCYGSCSFAAPAGSDFTPFKDLTQEQVLSWCYGNGVDQKAIEANVSLQIQNQIDPPVVALPLPWVAPAPVVVAEPVNTETPVAAVDEQAPVAEAPAA